MDRLSRDGFHGFFTGPWGGPCEGRPTLFGATVKELRVRVSKMNFSPGLLINEHSSLRCLASQFSFRPTQPLSFRHPLILTDLRISIFCVRAMKVSSSASELCYCELANIRPGFHGSLHKLNVTQLGRRSLSRTHSVGSPNLWFGEYLALQSRSRLGIYVGRSAFISGNRTFRGEYHGGSEFGNASSLRRLIPFVYWEILMTHVAEQNHLSGSSGHETRGGIRKSEIRSSILK